MKKKIIPYHFLITMILILLLILVFKDAVYEQLTYNTNAIDIVGDGEELKRRIVAGLLGLDSLLFRFNMWHSFLFPILIVVSLNQYIYVRKRNIKYYIGKNDGYLYPKIIMDAKKYFAKQNVLYFSFLFFCIVLVSFLFGQFEIAQINEHFHPSNFLVKIVDSEWKYLVYYYFVKCVAVYALSMLAFVLADYFNHFIQASLSFLIIIWLMTPLLHRFLPFYLIPFVGFMITSFNELKIHHILLPTIVLLGIILIIKWKTNNEVD